LLALGQWQMLLGREQEAFAAYKRLVTDAPDYPDAPKIYRELTKLAVKLGKKEDAEKFAREAERPTAERR
jgi:TolA-binding protein